MIVFDKDLATNKHLWIFNNNIIKFHDDGINTPAYCDISITDIFSTRIYPINGIFTFNFKEYLKAITVKNKLADLTTFSIDNTLDSLVYDDTENTFFDFDFDFIIEMLEGTPVTLTKNYKFLKGVEQLEDFQRQEYPQINSFLLNQLSSRSKKDYYLNYWEGYPFDISLYSITTGDVNIKNQTNGLDIDLPLAENTVINRISFCDANSNITIEDHLPLLNGLNKITITRPNYVVSDDEAPIDLIINKHKSTCGVYIKYRNASGGWSYWLFYKNNNKERSTSNLEDLANDFNNIEDTISPTIQGGVESSSDRIIALAKGINYSDIRTLEYLIDSPKIYLFTGERFSISPGVENRWIEIKCNTKKLTLKEAKRNKFDIPFDFALPKRNTVSLL